MLGRAKNLESESGLESNSKDPYIMIMIIIMMIMIMIIILLLLLLLLEWVVSMGRWRGGEPPADAMRGRTPVGLSGAASPEGI